MSTAVRHHHRTSSIERSRHGFKLSLPQGKRLVSLELTRKQVQALEERLSEALHKTEPYPLVKDEDRWLDPQIM
jgi:hypothetical protein